METSSLAGLSCLRIDSIVGFGVGFPFSSLAVSSWVLISDSTTGFGSIFSEASSIFLGGFFHESHMNQNCDRQCNAR